MADPAQSPADTGQPKTALHYRQGGDHCGACMYFNRVDTEKGTCPRVTPHDVDVGDVCDDFARAGRERDQSAEAEPKAASGGMAANLAQRGLISDKAMAGMRGGY